MTQVVGVVKMEEKMRQELKKVVNGKVEEHEVGVVLVFFVLCMLLCLLGVCMCSGRVTKWLCSGSGLGPKLVICDVERVF